MENKVNLNLLFETSWEVCNKVGGIYTVLSTKAKNLQTLYKDKVIFLGPDVWSPENPCPVFKESKTLLKRWRETSALPFGIKVRIGRWEIPGRPIAVLVSFDGMYAQLNNFYAEMWNHFGVDSLHAYGDYGEGCAFALAAGIVIESLTQCLAPDDSAKVIAHFDEWTTGMGLLYVRNRMPRIGTVFTTHATSIGRSICGNGKNLYQYFSGYNGDQMARELNMEAKHSLEKAAAHFADCFTTVSDITADECEQLLERRPDVVTPNGFEENFVPAPEKYASRRKTARRLLLKVANSLSGANFDDDTFIVATSGRCEYRNKGLDMFIDSLNKLGQLDAAKRVLAFIMVPAWLDSARHDLALNLSLSSNNRLESPFITHTLHNYGTDAVFNHLKNSDFRNLPESRVSVIYVPCYLNGNDGIFNKKYYDLLPGVDATVFASYYEPWGYTPLESIAFGVPTVTTPLSGFGRWILSGFANDVERTGVKVIDRNDTNYPEACAEIAATLKHLIATDNPGKEAVSFAARQTAHAAAWDYFIKYYIDSYTLALKAVSMRLKSNIADSKSAVAANK